MKQRICVMTAGHLSTCPRMLKAADALAEAGYRVRVVSARHTGWAAASDAEVCRRRAGAWDWRVVDVSRGGTLATGAWTGARRRGAEGLACLAGPARLPLWLAERAFSRVHPELVRAALEQPADLFYGGTTGALGAAAEAARRAGAPYGLDLEDFHSGEQEPGPWAGTVHGLAVRIERAVLPTARFLTTSSEAIAAAYARAYGLRPLVVHNVFPLPAEPPDTAPAPGEGLRLYWFSQTIGPGRGLEDAVRAMGLAAIPGELHLRGRAMPPYLLELERLAEVVAPALKIVVHEPGPPDAMVPLCAGLDVGLSLEPPRVLNRRLCLSNKAFTYMLAGLAVVFTDTESQRPLAAGIGAGAILYAAGDIQTLAAGLRRWAEDKALLHRARAAAWEAAKRRWHWEHPAERGALLAAVGGALAAGALGR